MRNRKSMPDSFIMLELCEILGITVSEMLSGEENNGCGFVCKSAKRRCS